MSRVSRKSELSPSITKGSNGIDLGKNSGIDMGRKSQPSITSGGIGITQDITNVGGMNVSGGIEVDITPVDFGVTVDSSEGTVSVAGGAEVPGGLIGISGGVEIDLNTGEITGGSIGGEVGGLGINLSNSKKGGIGIEFTVQIPGTPIELSLGFGFPPKKEEPISPSPPETSRPGVGSTSDVVLPLINDNCYYYVIALQHGTPTRLVYAKPLVKVSEHWFYTRGVWTTAPGCDLISQERIELQLSPSFIEWHDYPNRPDRAGYSINSKNYALLTGGGLQSPAEISGNVAISYAAGVATYDLSRGTYTKTWINYCINSGGIWEFSVIETWCPNNPPNTPPKALTPIRNPTPTPTPTPTPFPNPPPRKQKKMDVCCRENLKFLRAIYTQLGLFKFPGQLPATIIQEVAKEGEEPAEPQQVPIFTLVDLLMWQFERDDERWGQWQVQIDIKDSDITKEGDQKKSIKLPNLAESIAEFEGQLLSIMTNVEALVALQVKNLAESGMARQEAIKGYLASKAIIKYMAFKSTEVDVPVPMTFTAGAETISALLEESEGHIKGTDYVEKETLRDVYLDLLQAAAIIRAVHWQRINTKTDTKSQLLSILKNSVDLAASITKPQNPNGDGSEKTFNPENNFEDFIDSVEDGFRNSTGITDIQNPYGKPPNRRPRIRQIGDNISQAGGSD